MKGLKIEMNTIMIGRQYDMLLVLEHAGTKKEKGSHTYSLWKCRCDCGKEVIVPSYRLRTGICASCGCMNKTKKQAFIAYKQEGIKAARELYYPEDVIKDIHAAKTEGEIERIMVKARHGGYGSNGQ